MNTSHLIKSLNHDLRLCILLTFVSIILLAACNSRPENETTAQAADPYLEKLNQNIKDHPDLDSLYWIRGNYLMESKSSDLAIADFLKALSIDSTGKPQYFVSLAEAYLMSSQSRLASSTLSEAMRIFPDHIPTLLKSAELHLILKQHMQALAVLDRLFARDPQNVEAWYLSGHVFYELGDTGKAVNSYQRSVDLDPHFFKGWKRMGDLLTELELAKAVDYYNNALRLDSTDPMLYHDKAFALKSFGREQEAFELFRIICEKFPSYEPGYYNMGLLLAERDSVEQAIEHFSICIRLEPTEPSSYIQRGKSLLRLKKNAEAKLDFETALKIDPDNIEAAEALKK